MTRRVLMGVLASLAVITAFVLNGWVFVPHQRHVVRTVATMAAPSTTSSSSTTTSSTTTTTMASPPTTRRPVVTTSRPVPPAVRGSAAGGTAVATWYFEGC